MSTTPMIEVTEDVLRGALLTHGTSSQEAGSFMSSIRTAAEAAENEQAARTRAGWK